MKSTLLIVQIISSLFLILLIAIQSNGNSLNRTISSSVITKFGKRGIEKLVMKMTVIFVALVISVSVLLLILP
ncbi:preprotein translocase subunit SecG [Candidatus Woesebacteria bacterium RIFOXYA1_FULL_43_9]|uniref:Protein-export membrane protein SecG n=1 Tax=Candidatus Woesebacteria bacterium RIFOXYA1_FULL_43_9 TaxID=1802534 RepID=A0A1F8CJU0_9BACT|nr:MAG: preprotein translocase subunit SecG [Candidatus Woesebacteria bacterium RIFOXYA1_FULL_43_9]